MLSTYILTNVPYNTSDIALGGLLPDPRYPNQNILDEANIDKDSQEVAMRTENNIHYGLKSSDRSWFDTQLSRLMSVSYEGSSSDSTTIVSREGRVYELKQPTSVFKNLCQSTDVREWFQEGIQDGEKSYMIVGYRTFFDASTTVNKEKSTEASAKAVVPVADIAAAVPGAGKVVDIDVGLSGGHASNSEGSTEATFPGERIYAICYRRVKFNTWPWKPSGPKLENTNQWVMFTESRGQGHQKQNAEAVEASLEDEEPDDGLLYVAELDDGTAAFGLLSD